MDRNYCLLVEKTFKAGDVLISQKASAWWVEVDLDQGVTFSVSHAGQESEMSLPSGFCGVLTTNVSQVILISGCINARKLNFSRLSKLQAFIDIAIDKATVDKSKPCRFAAQPVDIPSEFTEKYFDLLLMKHCIAKSPSGLDISNVLRSHEGYNLVSFLISQIDGSMNLKELGQMYGLSPAQFRRLTKTALGNVVKTELSDWKLIRAILDMIDGNENITHIAYKHGYSSLSHFSNAVKNSFYMPPKQLIKAIRNIAQK